MKKTKIALLLFVIAGLVFVSSPISIAGGEFQGKIQRKLDAPKNIQYNLDAARQTYSAPPSQSEAYLEESEKDSLSAGTAGSKKERRLSAVVAPAPVFSAYAVYRTNYKAEIEEGVVTVKGNALFEVFKKGWTQIPLVKSSVGLIDVGVNRGASFITMQGGKYYLMIDKPGRYNLDIEFLIKATRERENGPGNFSFEVMPAPISQFEFVMPESGVEIFVEPAIKLELKREAKKTVAWAVMPNTENITVRWTKALPKETITQVKLEPKVYLDTATYASVGEGIIRCQANLNYSILQSEISTLRLALPEDVSVLDVKGRDLRDWKVSVKEGLQYLDVYFSFGVKGDYTLSLVYERKIGEGSVVAEVPWVRAMGVEREKGYFGIAAATNVELAVNKIEHVNLIDVKELPSSIWGSSANPILLAFKYLNQPFSIAIDVTRHEELPVLVAAIDSADFVTLQTDEGKGLTKAIYQVRNNVKQFIRLVLPKDAALWSVFVAGKPVKPAKDKNGNILIPLEKSQLSGENLTQFPVEIVYLDKTAKMGLAGSLKLQLPQTDIPVGELNWLVYLPLDYLYFNFGGNIRQAKRYAQLLSTFSKSSAVGGLKRGDKLVYDESSTQYSPGVGLSLKEVQSAQMKGVLPIKIEIPQQGRLYRFSKLLVTEQENSWVSVNFITVFKQIHGFIKLLLIIFVIVLIAGLLKKIKLKKA